MTRRLPRRIKRMNVPRMVSPKGRRCIAVFEYYRGYDRSGTQFRLYMRWMKRNAWHSTDGRMMIKECWRVPKER